jgi:signal transduction histidine kinase
MKRMRSSPPEIPSVTPESAALPVGALISAAATAIGVLVAEFLVPAGAHTALGVCGALAVLAVALAGAQAARRARTAEGLARRLAGLEASYGRRLELQEAETGRLATEVLPESIARMQGGDSVEEVLDATARDPELGAAFVKAHEAVVRSVLEAVKAEEDLRDSAQRAFVNVARRVQAIVHQQFQDLREMEERHGGAPEVFDDLLHLDHGTALIGRLADSLAVLGGSRPGRQWPQPVPLFNILRGAMSRITDYQRVELHSVVEVAVAGPAVEPLIHALAELLDNATRYSPPHTRVHLTAIEVQSGIAIEVEDGGVGLSEEGRARAERVLAQISSGLDLAGLGETPRLGLSVVGRLAQANRFQVSLRPSAYAGVRAVLTVPRDLITAVPASAGPALHSTAPARAASSLSVPPAQPATVEINGDGLPQRRRAPLAPLGGPARGALPGAATAGGPPAGSRVNGAAANPAAPAVPEKPAPQPGLWLAAFQDAVSGDGGEGTQAARRPPFDEPSSKEGRQS